MTLRRLVDRRLQPRPGERRARDPRSRTPSSCCRGATRRPPRPASSATSTTSTARPFEGDPRQVLRRHLDAAHATGFTFYVAPDIEFFYFAPPSAASRRCRSTRAASSTSPPTTSPATLRKQTIRTLETMGIPVEYSFHEDAPSQHEIDLRHTDALTMADSIMTFRLVVQEVAATQRRARHVHAQAARGRAGLGHARPPVALRRRRERVLRRRRRRTTCRRSAKRFMAGLLRHAAEITAVTNQTVNSYKRLVPGFEAPVHVSWARNNRSGLIRVPIPKRGNPQRHPHRVPLARSGVQPVPRLQRDARRRHARRRARATSCPPRPTPTCSR